ncbi:hypothetical protein V7075_28765, partial [Neobacillus drentensis]|uniref:hypothetical protein n=1 Tax=Neobacillus drentensis TaxID=220684 RepID=UPI002FFE31CC
MLKNKVKSMVNIFLSSAIVFGGIGQTVVAEGNNDANQGKQKISSEENVKQWLSEYEFYEDTRDGLIYEKVAINELKRFVTVIKDKNAK